MYATFSPDATKVAYVLRNDIHVEDVATGAIRRITRDGSDLVVNGGSDWVNEEELDLHDCFRWSPDGRRIAFWQFDLHGVGNFSLQYYLGEEKEIVTRIPYPKTGPYPVTMSVPYPLAGATNSAVRAGVVDSNGGTVKWLEIPGDPREHYIARLQWADRDTVLVQQLNRLQNTDAYLQADARSGRTREMWRDRDEAFITIGFGGLPEARPIRDGAEFLVLSEKDGWMHVYRVARDGRETLVTRGSMDASGISGVDEKGGWLVFIASPQNPTQRYLYRAPLDGSSDPVRVTPETFSGTNTYDISPDGKYAFHGFSKLRQSRFARARDPARSQSRSTDWRQRRCQREGRVAAQSSCRVLQSGRWGGVAVDGYLIKPPAFDPSKKYPCSCTSTASRPPRPLLDSWGGSTLSTIATSRVSGTWSRASTTLVRLRRAGAPGGRPCTDLLVRCPRSSRQRRCGHSIACTPSSISIVSRSGGGAVEERTR